MGNFHLQSVVRETPTTKWALTAPPIVTLERPSLCRFDDISEAHDALICKFSGVMSMEPSLTRQMVSFQSNKTRPFYRLYKFKEAFSAELVEYLLLRYGIQGPVLDCFAGAGTTLFAASEMGLNAEGIDILPCSRVFFEGRSALREISKNDVRELSKWRNSIMWMEHASRPLNKLRISALAYPPETEESIGKFLEALSVASPRVRKVLMFALVSVLEDVSYTRKDGQFLRWDNRSGRKLKAIFHKGHVPSFAAAISEKIGDMLVDLGGFDNKSLVASPANISLKRGSCLSIMPSLPAEKYGAVITSPPYCNRYDYTRTYALELALLGINEEDLSGLRQSMLSCTVENKEKDLSAINKAWVDAARITDNHPLLSKITRRLRQMSAEKILNNNGIPRMVEGYFREMTCVIQECARVIKPGGKVIMVNDNVRYGGIEIPVDLILADIAERAGFRVVDILILPKGKGNSSQQMGAFGRSELRKCIYCWEMP